ncbi:Arm DNA-binding domain-containing protein [Pseudomonas sp. EZ-C24]|uniref:Arm DNA-binding domain-containing protein n=1 Tax=Pseudomonas sp. EZ-C24 TaxID=2753617 RepID=UPI00293463FD|nr:Arm DNA-binding domain-containing protein [Pseudomonas sp. EZ-C24]
MGSLTIKGIAWIIKKGQPGKTGDGDGLYPQISKAGVPSWIYRYKSDGKSREMGLGRYPDVTLADAKGAASDHRKIRLSGVDPLEARNGERQKRKASAQASAETPSFRELAHKYHLKHTEGMSEKWKKGWIRKFELHAFDYR